jgi:hypothetical protein
MNRYETDLRDAGAHAWATTRITGRHLLRIGLISVDRCGVAFQVLRGRRARRSRRTIVVTAVAAGAAGALATIAVGYVALKVRSADPADADGRDSSSRHGTPQRTLKLDDAERQA